MEAIINNLTKAIGWSIVHSLWQGAIIFALLFIAISVKSKMTARLKHNLSMGALFLIFISFCLTFASLFNLPVKSIANHTSPELNGATLQQLYSFTHSWSFRTESYFPFIVALYILGIGFQLVLLVSSYLKLKQLKQFQISPIPADWLTIAQSTLSKLGISKPVKFYLSEKVNVPLTIGFLKPVVLFPIALLAQLDMRQVEAILIHELSHIRRNDYLFNLIKTGIETLLFFNPFVWLTSRFIQIEREHACDDLVVKLTDAPIAYAHVLLKLELIKDKAQPALSLAATGKNQHLYQRIKRITDMKTSYMNAKQKLWALCLTLATVISLAWINPTQKEISTPRKVTKVNTVKTIIGAANDEKNQLTTFKADTDSVKKTKREIYIKHKDGRKVIYNSIDEMPDSVKAKLVDLEKNLNSPEWKDKMAKIEFNAKEIAEKFDSPEWKEKMAKIEFNAKDLDKMFSSKEWKNQMAKIEFKAKDLEKMFESKEWKDKMAKIEFNAKEMDKIFSSPEWKEKIKKVEFNAKEMDKMLNSKEWKDNMNKIELKTKELEKKFDSPERKNKIKEMEELKNSPEYKKLRERYEKDLEELKKKKGISTDKAFLLYDGSMPMQVATLPLAIIEPIQKTLIDLPKTIIKIDKPVTIDLKTLGSTGTN